MKSKPKKVAAPQSIGEYVKAQRDLRGWSQMDLAEKCNSSPSVISRIECGRDGVGLALGRELCNVLGIDLNELFSHPKRKK